MYLCTGSYTQSLNRNIKAKCEKMLVAAQAIRLICSNPGVKVVRKLKAQKLLIMSQVSPICLYGVQDWFRVSDAQYGAGVQEGDHNHPAQQYQLRGPLTSGEQHPCADNGMCLSSDKNRERSSSAPFVPPCADKIKLKCWNYELWVKAQGKIVRDILTDVEKGI